VTRKTLALFVGLLVLMAATSVAAEPDAGPAPATTHVKSPFHVTTEAGSERDFAPSWIVPEVTWSAIDLELKRLQTAEVRLGAENDSLRKSALDDGPGWGTIVAVASALAAGILGGRMLF
jgi:hypothetical protein